MNRITIRSPEAWSFILLTAAALTTAALASAQPAGPGPDPHRTDPGRRDDPGHLVVRPLHELRADTVGNDSLVLPARLAPSCGEGDLSIPADSVQHLRNVEPPTDEVVCRTSLDGAPDGYDYILAWVQAMTSNPDSTLGSLRHSNDHQDGASVSGKASDAPAAGDDHAMDGDELELIGARTQALYALQDFARRHKALSRPVVPERLDPAR